MNNVTVNLCTKSIHNVSKTLCMLEHACLCTLCLEESIFALNYKTVNQLLSHKIKYLRVCKILIVANIHGHQLEPF